MCRTSSIEIEIRKEMKWQYIIFLIYAKMLIFFKFSILANDGANNGPCQHKTYNIGTLTTNVIIFGMAE